MSLRVGWIKLIYTNTHLDEVWPIARCLLRAGHSVGMVGVGGDGCDAAVTSGR